MPALVGSLIESGGRVGRFGRVCGWTRFTPTLPGCTPPQSTMGRRWNAPFTLVRLTELVDHMVGKVGAPGA